MAQEPRKLGILLSVTPEDPNFHHAMQLAGAALNAKVEVYLYCLHDGVKGSEDDRLQALRIHGLRLFACSFSAQRRKLPQTENALYGGLTMLNDMMATTDRLVSFN